MTRDIFKTVVSALLVAILAAALQTYVAVRMLPKDVAELRSDLDKLYGETSDVAQRMK
jgi:hypothetical protein